jgi:cellulose synthase operon protein C
MPYVPKITLKLALIPLLLSATVFVGGCGSKAPSPKASLEAAQVAVSKGDFPAASVHLKNVLAAKPEDAASRIALGQIYIGMGEFSLAESDLRKGLELGGDKQVAVPMLLESLAMQEQFQKVIDEAKRLKDPNAGLQALISTYSGRANFALRQLDKAKEDFSAALQLAPNNAAARIGQLALTLVKDTDLAPAKAELSKILTDNPKSYEAWAMSGYLNRLEGKNAEAKVMIQNAIALKKYDIEQRGALVRCLVDLREFTEANEQIQAISMVAPKSTIGPYLSGLVAYRQGNFRLSRDFLQRVVAVDPNFQAALELAAETAIQNREFGISERHAKTLIEKNPQNYNAYRLLAATYLAQNFPEKAMSVLQPLLEAKVNSPAILATVGEALIKTGESKKGIEYLDAAASAGGGTAGLSAMAASARIASGDAAAGLAQLEQASTKNKSAQTDLIIAQAFANAKKFDKANELIAKFIQAQPKDPAGRHALAMNALAQGNQEEAEKRLTESLTLNPSFQPSLDAFAQIDMRAGRLDVATKRYSDALAKDPKNTAVLLALAGLSARTAGGEEATLSYFKQARDADLGSPQVAIAQSQYYIQTSQADKAVALLEQVLPNFATDPDTNDALAVAYDAMGAYGKAIPILEKQIELNPLSAALNYRVGTLRMKLQDVAGAGASFQRAIQLQPNAPEPRAALATTLFASGKKSEATAAAQALKVAAPKSPLGALLAGDFLTADGKKVEALAQYKEAYGLVKNTSTAIKIYLALQANGNSADAAQFLRAHWQGNPSDTSFMLSASEFLLEKKDWKEAVAVVKEVLKVNKDSSAALNNAAIAMHQLKEPRAVELAQRAYQLEPHNFAIQDTVGFILMEQGKVDQALPLLKSSAAKAPRNAEVRLHYAQALAKKGDSAGAKAEATQALQNNAAPDVKAAAEALLK